MDWPTKTPQPPYYAVIFTSTRRVDDEGYVETARRMEAMAGRRPGFLGMESAQDDEREITVSYWTDLDAIRAWKGEVEHAEAQRLGRECWYERYSVRVARVERAYDSAE